MRTTVELPDDLVRAARVRAAERDETLKELFTRALSKELEKRAPRERRALPVIGARRAGSSTVTPEELEQILNEDDAGRSR